MSLGGGSSAGCAEPDPEPDPDPEPAAGASFAGATLPPALSSFFLSGAATATLARPTLRTATSRRDMRRNLVDQQCPIQRVLPAQRSGGRSSGSRPLGRTTAAAAVARRVTIVRRDIRLIVALA